MKTEMNIPNPELRPLLNGLFNFQELLENVFF